MLSKSAWFSYTGDEDTSFLATVAVLSKSAWFSYINLSSDCLCWTVAVLSKSAWFSYINSYYHAFFLSMSQCYLKVHGSPTEEKFVRGPITDVAVLSKSAWFSYNFLHLNYYKKKCRSAI